jgi:hypothetical protein
LNLPDFAANLPSLVGVCAVFQRWVHSNRRLACLAVSAALFVPGGGCALFKAENWNPNKYRDQRAVDIEKRLDSDEPIVKNPF